MRRNSVLQMYRLEGVTMDVLEALEQKMWPHPAHAWLYEVQDATGGRARRRADALVCSCWPSNGIWLAGIELKMSRSDWLREKKDPGKAWGIGRYCHYWWLACPDGLVAPEEVPEAWGLVTVGEAGKPRVRKSAPRRDPEPVTVDFFASLMRQMDDACRTREQRAAMAARDETKARLGTEALQEEVLSWKKAASQAEGEKGRLELSVEHWKHEAERSVAVLRRFCEATGVSTELMHQPSISGLHRMIGVAEALLDWRFRDMEERFRKLADSMKAARELAESPKEGIARL